MGSVTVGIDVGQKHDPTAIAVVEGEARAREGRAEVYHVVRHLERLPLGTPYPGVATRLGALATGLRDRGTPAGEIYVDATGVGLPVVDTIKAAGVRCVPVYFTYGDRRVVQQDGTVSLGKAWLVSRLQVLLQTGLILLPKTAEAQALAKELMDYEIRVDQDANDKYGAFTVGSHDDLVTALGLAVQGQTKTVPGWNAGMTTKTPQGRASHRSTQHARRYTTS